MVTKKQKERKNADFKKVKLKVGKKLKKTSTTDATFSAKKLVLTSQLADKQETDEAPLSFRGLTLGELCKQLGHFNKAIRKDALAGTKQLLTSRPDLIVSHLRTLIPSIARLLNESATDPALNAQLKSLLAVICSVPEQSMSAHFTLLLAHVLRALTNMEMRTRLLALSVLSMLMKNYPRLCRNNADLFSTFVKFLSSPRKPQWNSANFLDKILSFITVYEADSDEKYVQPEEAYIDFKLGTISEVVSLPNSSSKMTGPFDFPVFSSCAAVCASPFELPKSLISLSCVLAPIIATSLMEDTGGAHLTSTLAIIDAVGRATMKQTNAFLVSDFNQKLGAAWNDVKKAALTRKNERIRQAVTWIPD